MADDRVFVLEGVTKTYKMGEVEVKALINATFDIKRGELVVVLGPSGSGKSTLLNLLGGMDVATSGKITFEGTDITRYNEIQFTQFRRNNVGFIFQFYNLMPNLTAKENVELATKISQKPLDIVSVLEKVGLKERADHFPSQLSGGEQQRVAIARAVAKNPDVLLCDEPTGALDYTTGKLVLKLLNDINRETGKTVIIIAHNQPIADMAKRVIKLRSGEIVESIINNNPTDPGTYIITCMSVFVFTILAQTANKKNISGLDMVEVLKNREN
ncbi:MAG: ABC transporter ATP-binding protein [Caulobacteraceae bacterium]